MITYRKYNEAGDTVTESIEFETVEQFKEYKHHEDVLEESRLAQQFKRMSVGYRERTDLLNLEKEMIKERDSKFAELIESIDLRSKHKSWVKVSNFINNME